MDSITEKKLFELTPVEHKQINSKKHVQDVPYSYNQDIASMPVWNFFKNGNISVTRSNRFSYIPAHMHDFIELNYVYSGTSKQYINDKKITLHKGQAIIMDRTVQQRIDYANEQDILINILIKDDREISNLVNSPDITSSRTVATFFTNILNPKINHNNYIVFDFSNNKLLTNIIESLITESITKKEECNINLLRLLMEIWIEESDASITLTNTQYSIENNKDLINKIVNFINSNYNSVSLKSLSKVFGYNSNYLGDKIYKETGHTFKYFLQMRKFNIASNLILNTDMSIENISQIVGYKNHSSLYRLFKIIVGISPNEYKQNTLHQIGNN